MKLITVFLLIFSVYFINADSIQCKANGCGSGWNEPLVPDKIGILGIDFNKACAAHDMCYGVCLPCGRNYGTEKCSQAKLAVEWRRKLCDYQFEESMKQACDEKNKNRFIKRACSGVASGYFGMVRIAGGGSFNGREVENYLHFLTSEEGRNFNTKAFEEKITNAVTRKANLDKQRIKITISKDKINAFVGDTAISEKVKYNRGISRFRTRGDSPLRDSILLNKDQLENILNQKPGHVYTLPQNLSFPSSQVEMLKMEKAVNQLMRY